MSWKKWILMGSGVLAVFLVLAFLHGGWGRQEARAAGSGPLYLPVVVRSVETQTVPPPEVGGTPTNSRVFGVEVHYYYDLDQFPQQNFTFSRRNALLWSEVERNRGERNWTSAAQIEPGMKFAAAHGVETLLIVRSTPGWAQKFSGEYCGPIKETAFQDFARFMADVVKRYSAPPYSVKYFELWNEPDIAPGLVDHKSIFGCWGDASDPYYGGGYYGEMLKVVYPAIKAANPNAEVLVGGLLLDCNYNIPGACVDEAATRPPHFLEGILRAVGKDYFDGISFHAYDRYEGKLGEYTMPVWANRWDTTGPLVIEKTKFLREILARYRAEDRYLINTETAMMVNQKVCDAACEETKSYYAAQVFAATIAEGLRGSIWYAAYANWKHTDLLDGKGGIYPVYTAYSVSFDQLKDVQYIRELDEFPGLMGYVFRRGGRTLWVVWALDHTLHEIALPAKPNSILDVYGKAQSVTGARATVGVMPLYIELP